MHRFTVVLAEAKHLSTFVLHPLMRSIWWFLVRQRGVNDEQKVFSCYNVDIVCLYGLNMRSF